MHLPWPSSGYPALAPPSDWASPSFVTLCHKRRSSALRTPQAAGLYRVAPGKDGEGPGWGGGLTLPCPEQGPSVHVRSSTPDSSSSAGIPSSSFRVTGNALLGVPVGTQWRNAVNSGLLAPRRCIPAKCMAWIHSIIVAELGGWQDTPSS